MAEINFYELLGVAEDATPDSIKRSYRRKRSEFSQNEDMLDKLNQAYTVLLDPEQRRNYDNASKYGKRLTELWDRYHDAESRKEAREILLQLRTIYKQMESANKEDILTLRKLFEIERELGEEKELPYLNAIMNVVSDNEKLENKIDWLRYLGENYVRYEKVDEAIKVYFQIYKMDATDNSVCDLVDLLYRKKKNIKVSIQILNDCINRVDDKQLKAKYYSKSYEVVSSLNGENYDKVKKVLLAKLQTFRGEEEPLKTLIALQIALIMGQSLDNEELACYDELDKIFRSFAIENEDAKLLYRALQEFRKVIANNKYHECLKLLSEDIWTETMRRKMEVLMLNEMEEIKESLDYLKKFAPTMWKMELEDNQNIETLVNRLYPLVKEYRDIMNNPNISNELKTMLRALAFEGIIRFEKMESKFAESRDIFFDDKYIDMSRQELKLLARLYPASYQRFSDIFFDGQSIDELLGEEPSQVYSNERAASKKVFYPNAKEGYEHKPYIDGFLELLFIVIGTCCFPPALPIIFIAKYYARHQKSILKVTKRVLLVAIPLLIVAGIYVVSSYIREKQYEESHNGILTDAEVKKIEQLEDVYAQKAGINIIYIQSEESQVEVDGNYILLSYYINHSVWENGYGIHTRGILTQEQTDELGSEIYDMLDEESLSDYEKCEKFFEITYDYIVENDISEEAYEEHIQNQEKMKSYSITQDGTYGVGYSEGMINPGSYKVKAEGDIDNQFNMVYMSLYRNGGYAGQYTIGSFPISITLQDGDEINISYNGRGSYNLILNENASTTEMEEEVKDDTWEINMSMIFYAMATNSSLKEFVRDIQIEPFKTYSYESGGSKGIFNTTIGNYTGVLHYSDTEEIGFYLETNEPITEDDVIEIFNAVPVTNVNDNNQVFVWDDKVEIEVYYHSYCTAFYFRLYSDSADAVAR